ncbi:hypothetical protein JCM14635_18490 [Megalodesulfovibrio paquesii]
MKLLSFLVGTALFVGLGITGACYFIFTDYFNKHAEEEISSKAYATTEYLADQERTVAAAAYLGATMQDLGAAVVARDHEKAQALAKQIWTEGGLNSASVTDTTGWVLARGHSDRWDDNIIDQANVRGALAGKVTTGVETATVVKFSVRAAAPIRLDGKIVGALVVGRHLSMGDALVDRLKTMLGVECSIFEGETRVSTTLMNNGQRAAGEMLNNPKIAEVVLTRGDKFVGRNMIMGQEYNAAYMPIRDGDGKISGMIGIAVSRKAIQQATQDIFLPVLMAVAALLLAALVIGSLAWSSSLLEESTRSFMGRD